VPLEIIWMLQRSASLSTIANSITASEFLNNFTTISSKYIEKYENSLESQVFNLESHFYLQSQLLRDSDWASMSSGIELRTPFVDYFLFQKLKPFIPSFSNYKNKLPLYKGLDNFPKQVLAQQKSGFNIPIREWYTKKTEERIDYKIGSNWIDAVYDNYTRSLTH
jgi:asparagine synthase (glutamine-hydrolysing)